MEIYAEVVAAATEARDAMAAYIAVEEDDPAAEALLDRGLAAESRLVRTFVALMRELGRSTLAPSLLDELLDWAGTEGEG
jgi:hypothetical protein